MSISIYCEMTRLPNVSGRVDYISNPKRQENLLATASTVEGRDFWRQLGADSQEAWRSAGGPRTKTVKRKNKETGEMESVEVPVKCIEGRELMTQLPNSVLKRRDLGELAAELATGFKEKYGVECAVAIHLNKKKTNVHCHVVFAERRRLPEPEIRIADRNVFLDERGVRRRTKKEILDADGQLRPGCRIVAKGDVLRCRYFSAKEEIFSDEGWLQDYKADMAAWINDRLKPDLKREVFDDNSPYLAQQKVGKGRTEENEVRIQAYNKDVKNFNQAVRTGYITEEQAYRIKNQVLLAPDRLQALRAAWHMETKNTVAVTEQLQGGIRTATGPDEAKKRRLRELHRLAAEYRRQARETADPMEKKLLQAEARKCSAQIDRLRMELGYYKPDDYVRRKKRIDEDLRKKREWALRSKEFARSQAERWCNLDRSVKNLRAELFDLEMKIFPSAADKARMAQIRAKIPELEQAMDRALVAEREARQQAREARQAYRQAKQQARIQRRELRESQRQQSKGRSGPER